MTTVEPATFAALVAAGAGVVVLVMAGALAWSERVPPWEADLFDVLNGLPGSARFVLWPLMQLGMIASAAIVPAVALVLLRRWPPAVAAATAALGAWVTAKVVKEIVQRGRPPTYVNGVTVREGDGGGLGFVSGHAAVSAALLTALWPYLSWPLRVSGVVLVALVAVARVFYGAHLPLDVLGGAALGVICGALACLVVRATSTPAGRSEPDERSLGRDSGTR